MKRNTRLILQSVLTVIYRSLELKFGCSLCADRKPLRGQCDSNMRICPCILKRNSDPGVCRAHLRVSFKVHSLKSVASTCVAKSLNQSIFELAMVESLCFVVNMKETKTELLPTKLEHSKAYLNKNKKIAV